MSFRSNLCTTANQHRRQINFKTDNIVNLLLWIVEDFIREQASIKGQKETVQTHNTLEEKIKEWHSERLIIEDFTTAQ
jgi:hypothetical protein